ncbi:MAG: YgaP family membrane protein [Lacibacter sp.]
MKKNLGNIDRVIRLVAAGILAMLWFQNMITGTWAMVALAVAVIFAITGFISWCPIYAMFGLKSIPKKLRQ